MTKVDLSALKNKYAELESKISVMQEEIKTESQKIVEKCFLEFLSSNPKIYAVGWTQYTNYWNDGEECYFCVHDLHFYLDDEAWDELGPYEGSESLYSSLEYYNKELASQKRYYSEAELNRYIADAKEAIEETNLTEEEFEFASDSLLELGSVISSIEDQFMEMIFGNHVKVLAKLVDGKVVFDIDEHSHE